MHYLYGCRVNGKTYDGIYIAAAQPPSPTNRLYVDDFAWDLDVERDSSEMQLIDKSNLIVMLTYVPPWNITSYEGGYNQYIKDYVILGRP